jgi:hypothetical protein
MEQKGVSIVFWATVGVVIFLLCLLAIVIASFVHDASLIQTHFLLTA